MVALPIALLIGFGAFAVGLVVGGLAVASFNSAAISRLASAADELRRQLDEKARELAAVRDDLSREQQAKAAAEARLEGERAHVAEQKQLVEAATGKLADTFNALAADALRGNNESFLGLARQVLEPVNKSLERYEQKVDSIEQHRQEAYGALKSQAEALLKSSQALQGEVGALSVSLRAPSGGGQWGQMALRRVVELAGMSEHCDFDEQVAVQAEDKRQRPDMVINLPNDRHIVVDAKAPLSAYAEAAGAASEAERAAALKRHAQNVRGHVTQLSSKGYWQSLADSPEFVVLFLPAESFFSAAVDVDRALIEYGIQNRVILATPTTLVALLMAVAYGWRQEQLAQNAQEISALGKELYERVATMIGHVQKIGKGLSGAVDAYNKAVGSIETRVLSSVRKFKALGAAGGDDLPELETVDTDVRQIENEAGEA